MAPKRTAGEMDGLAQVGARRLRIEIGPKGLHDLFAVNAMPAGEGQQLHQAAPRSRRQAAAATTDRRRLTLKPPSN